MRALVITEGSGEWGMGHLNRCLAFAQHLSSRGVEVVWCVRGDGIAEEFLRQVNGGTLRDWLAPEVLAGALDGCFMAIVDSYQSSIDAYALVSRSVRYCLWLDDDGRLQYPDGVVVSPSAPASLVQWCATHPGTRLLTGYEYQGLRAEFSDVAVRLISPHVGTVLVMMGGTDPRGLTAGVIREVRGAYPYARIEAVVPDAKACSAQSWLVDDRCVLHPRLGARGVRELMEAADLAVCAAGQTLCEACRTGLPTIAICVADNQVRHAEALARAGAVRLARWHGTAASGSALPDALRELAGETARRSLSSAGAGLIDGRGPSRVTAELLGWSERLELRAARASDSAAIREISNHPSVREHSLCKAAIALSEHEAWFAMAMADPALIFLVIVDPGQGNRVVGQLRYRIDADGRSDGRVATVSISFDPSIRGKGEAARVLREGDVRCFSRFTSLHRIEALIGTENLASQRSFVRAGYLRQSPIRTEGGSRYLSFCKERGNV